MVDSPKAIVDIKEIERKVPGSWMSDLMGSKVLDNRTDKSVMLAASLFKVYLVLNNFQEGTSTIQMYVHYPWELVNQYNLEYLTLMQSPSRVPSIRSLSWSRKCVLETTLSLCWHNMVTSIQWGPAHVVNWVLAPWRHALRRRSLFKTLLMLVLRSWTSIVGDGMR